MINWYKTFEWICSEVLGIDNHTVTQSECYVKDSKCQEFYGLQVDS